MRQMLTAMPRHNATQLIEPNNGYIIYQNHDSFTKYFKPLLSRISRLIPLICIPKISWYPSVSEDVNMSTLLFYDPKKAQKYKG